MGLFAISDLHLSSDNKKSMEVFGDKWFNYMERIKNNWKDNITEDDTIIIPGDVSWAMYLNESIDDFKYLNSLPGKKIILKGNHDYWWETLNKLNNFLQNNNFKNIFFLYNNSVLYEDILICGTRGWLSPDSPDFTQQDLKIFNREVNRLKLSLESGKNKNYRKIIVAIHYPPFNKSGELNKDIEELFKQYNVSMCIYGHLHGDSQNLAIEGLVNGTEFKMVCADYLNFMPYKIII